MEVKLREVKLNISYEDYIGPAILWASGDTESLAKALDVVKVVSQGSFIRGLFGGERKSGMELYAGLVVTDFKPADDGLYIRLFNTEKEYIAPASLMKKHGVDIYRASYLTTVNPFKCSTLNIILSTISEEELKKFIRELIQLNKENMSEADERKLSRLAEKLKAQVDILDSDSHYVIYRGKAVLTACVPEDLYKLVSESSTAYVQCKSAEQAHYYAAVLNYMAYKVISKKRAFNRHHYTKPLLALAAAGLTWKDLPAQLRGEIARLSYELSMNLKWMDYPNQKKVALEMAKRPEFVKIVELLDRYVEETDRQSLLDKALELVSSSGIKQERRRIESRI